MRLGNFSKNTRSRATHRFCAGSLNRRPRAFRDGRELAAWLGLVPRQHSSGGRPHLLGISKRSDTALRTLLIHGARAVIRMAATKPEMADSWVMKLCRRRHKYIAAVALAAKNARTAWVLLIRKQAYQVSHVPIRSGVMV